MITVVNKKRHVPTVNDVYVGRGSPLGNPYPITFSATREEVIERFRQYLSRELAEGDVEIREEMNRIWKAAKVGDVNLVCFCAPHDCHADIIKKLIEEKL